MLLSARIPLVDGSCTVRKARTVHEIQKGRLRGYIYKSLKVIFVTLAGRNITNKLPSTSPIEYWFQLQPATATASTTVTSALQLLFASQPAPTTGMYLR